MMQIINLIIKEYIYIYLYIIKVIYTLYDMDWFEVAFALI